MSNPVVSVLGEVTREVAAEIATISVSVTASDPDSTTALDQLAKRAEDLKDLLDSYDEDVFEKRETTGLYIYPQRRYRDNNSYSDLIVVGYSGTVTTKLVTANFSVLGELVLKLGALEEATVNGPVWGLRIDSPAYREARQAAVLAALIRASDYASAIGAEVTHLLSVSDTGLTSQSQPHYAARGLALESMVDGGSSASIDLSPTQQRVYAAVEAHFAITSPDLTA